MSVDGRVLYVTRHLTCCEHPPSSHDHGSRRRPRKGHIKLTTVIRDGHKTNKSGEGKRQRPERESQRLGRNLLSPSKTPSSTCMRTPNRALGRAPSQRSVCGRATPVKQPPLPARPSSLAGSVWGRVLSIYARSVPFLFPRNSPQPLTYRCGVGLWCLPPSGCSLV